MSLLPAQQDLSLYIHLPWCLHKCPYCDFNSHAVEINTLPEQRYIDSLILDLQQSHGQLDQRKVKSIFFGGGTPSLFSVTAIDRVLTACRQLIPLTTDCEITLETNPGTFEAQKFAEFLACGINRLSIGVQSFDDALLRKLERIHSAKEAIDAIETAQSIGFANINIDLMFGLPEQTTEAAKADIQQACTQQVDHISYYQLTLEPNTKFYRYPPQDLPDQDESWDIQNYGIRQLADAGYFRYEVSAFAQKNRHCRHNLNYWQFGDYLGLGAGAHSKISCASKIIRNQRTRQPDSYMQTVPSRKHVIRERILKKDELIFEFLLNNLRLVDGFPTAAFSACTGLPKQILLDALAPAMVENLVEQQHQQIRATEHGYRFLDELLQRFLPSVQ